MIGLIGRWSAKVSEMSLAKRCAWLNGAMAAVLVVCLAIAAVSAEPIRTLAAVLTAAFICTLSANIALVPALLWHGTPNGVNGALAGMLLGMFPPMAACLMFQLRGGPLTEAGVVYWILAFYLTALTVKTLLVAPAAISCSSAAGGPSNTVAGVDSSCINSSRVDPNCGAGA